MAEKGRMGRQAREKATVRTTVTMPKALYDEAQSYIDDPYETVNTFFVEAVEAYINTIRRKQIDAQFAGMAEDADHRRVAQSVSQEFSQSDAEASRLGGESK